MKQIMSELTIGAGRANYQRSWQHQEVRDAYRALQTQAARHYKTEMGAVRFCVFCQDCAISFRALDYYYTFWPRLRRRTAHDPKLRLAAYFFIACVASYGREESE